LKRHILIAGERGAGKSTLIKSLQKALGRPVYGFRTVREKADAEGVHPIYIHRASDCREDYASGPENRIGICDGSRHDANSAVFDTLGAAYIAEAQPGGVIIMDELGFMEKDAEIFKKAVFSALDGDIPVIAAVKARQDIGFLKEVRAHPKAEVYTLTPQNRDVLAEQLCKKAVEWREKEK